MKDKHFYTLFTATLKNMIDFRLNFDDIIFSCV